jgi:hypothetical protein
MTPTTLLSLFLFDAFELLLWHQTVEEKRQMGCSKDQIIED